MTHEDLLRRLALNDERALADVLGLDAASRLPEEAPELGRHVSIQIWLAALMATQAAWF